ncbi:MAG TPA: insulinase family protein, partial [Blastocatellia bacterium]|nr:insulinase family protein [Blastocatellia bacterium]
FYKTTFRPDKLVVAIAGDVSTFNTLVAVQQLYADFGVTPQPEAKKEIHPKREIESRRETQSKPQPASARTGGRPARPEPAQPAETAQVATPAEQPGPAVTRQPGLRYRAERADISQSIVSIGFEVPGPDSKDAPAFDLIAAILGKGRGARLRGSLLDGAAVLSRVESDYAGSPDKGLLATQMWTDPAQIDKAESEFFREVDRLRREVPAEGDMARARGVLEKEFVDEMGTYLGRALRLAQAEAYGVGFRAALDYRNRIRAVSAQDVQRVAAKYLTAANTRVHEYESVQAAPRTFDSERFLAAVAGWAPGFTQAVASARAPIDPNAAPAVVAQGAEKSPDQQTVMESIEPLAVRDFSTLNGPRAYVREDHSQPRVAVAVLMQVGRLAEDEATSGLTELMLQAMTYGTARRTAWQVASDLDQLGAELKIVSDPDFFGFMLSVLSRNADRALKIVRDLVEEPALRDEDVARARTLQAGIIREHRDSSPSRSHDLLFQALFPGHSYALPSRGREESVAKLTADQVREWHAKSVKRQLPLVVIVGDTDGSALVSSVVAEGFRRREVDKSFSAKVPGPRPPAERAAARRSPLSVVALGFMGPKAGSADTPVLELIKAVVNGEGGRFSTELRNRQAAVYQAHLDAEPLLTSGAVYAQIFASADSEQRARSLLLAELDRLTRSPLNASEIESARAFAVLSRQARMQSHEARAIEYARTVFSQQQASKVDEFIQDLSKLTPGDVQRVASLYFKPSGASIGAVRGNR